MHEGSVADAAELFLLRTTVVARSAKARRSNLPQAYARCLLEIASLRAQ